MANYPEDFGAVAVEDGGTGAYTTQLTNALQSNFEIDGRGKTYTFAGRIAPSSFKGLRNIKLVQLTPLGSFGGRALDIVGLSDWTIENVKIDCGNQGYPNGYMAQPCYQFHADTCANFKIRHLEVYYGGQGSAIRFDNCQRFTTENLLGHDMRYVLGTNYVFTANTTNGSSTLSNIANTGVFGVGMVISGTGIPAGTTVTDVHGDSLTISANAAATNANVSLTAVVPPATNDVIDIICYNSCTDFTAINSVSRDFSANNNGSETTLYCRGITTGQCVGFEYIGGLVDKVDQGWDFSGGPVTLAFTGNTTNGSTTISNIADATSLLVGTSISGAGIPGSAKIASIASTTSITISVAATATATGVSLTSSGVGNNGGTISAARAQNCETWGFKFANVQNRIIGNGLVAQNTGFAGFVFSPNKGYDDLQQTQDIHLSNCIAINPGGRSAGADGGSGFYVAPEHCNPFFPRGIKLSDCFAIDDRGTFASMKYGFANMIANPTLGGPTIKPSIAANCRSFGHTTSAFGGSFASSYTQMISSDTINISSFAEDVAIVLAAETGSSDELATIVSDQVEGSKITLYRGDQQIELKHGIGNLKLMYGRDRVMDDGNSAVVLIKRGSFWVESGWDQPTPVFASGTQTIVKTQAGTAATALVLQNADGAATAGTAAQLLLTPYDNIARSASIRAEQTVSGGNQIKLVFQTNNGGTTNDALTLSPTGVVNTLTDLQVGGTTVIDGARNVLGQATVASDANYTVTWFTSKKYQKHTGTLTANRTVTLSTTGAVPGATFRFTRTGGGAFTLSIGGLKSLATNTWCDVTFDGSAWYLSASGAL
jgi:hypothetical protein